MNLKTKKAWSLHLNNKYLNKQIPVSIAFALENFTTRLPALKELANFCVLSAAWDLSELISAECVCCAIRMQPWWDERSREFWDFISSLARASPLDQYRYR